MSKNTENISTIQEQLVPAKHIDKTASYKANRDRELVKGRFHFLQRPGGTLKFNFFESIGDQERPYMLKDGEVVEVPRKVARHLNNSGLVNVYGWYKDHTGTEMMRLERRDKRYYFENYDFFELEDIGPKDPIIHMAH